MQSFEEYKKEYGITLDDDQSEACRQIDGNVMLLAVPGSGKTTVMIARLGYMTRVLNINPMSILAITYSVAGTKEMKKRYENRFGFCDVEFRTIHGFCAVLINRYERLRGRRAFTLLDKDGDEASILRQIMSETGSFPTENELRDVMTAITYSKNNMLSLEEIDRDVMVDGRDFPAIYRAYEEFKLKNRLMDYDDQLVYGYRILRTCPDVCSVYADRFKYVCVDEAQDTSKLQHMIIGELSSRCGNLFMVGDEDQSIYGFRAAYPQALLDFGKSYPDAIIKCISKNYRSTGKIVSMADRFIKSNTERFGSDKKMVTDNCEGEAPLKVKLSDIRLLPDYVRRVYAENKGGTTALLFRLNDSMLPIIDMLYSKEIPFRSRGADTLFFTHTLVIDVLNILEFASRQYDTELFSKIYYKLNLGLTKTELQRAIQYNTGEDTVPIVEYIASSPFIKDFKRKKARKLDSDLKKIGASDTYEAIRTIYFETGYGKYCEYRGADVTKRNVLLALAYKYRSRDAFYKRLTDLEDAVKRESVSNEGIILSTIHSAKGMEFDRVLLCDCKTGILPSNELYTDKKIVTDEEKHTLEEERRLFYVGVTRAKKHLELITWEKEFGSCAEGFDFIDVFLNGERKTVKPQTVVKPFSAEKEESGSRLSDAELYALMKSYTVGSAIRHVTFGDGVILSKRDGFIAVRFARFQIPKKLELKICIENGLIHEI